MEVFTGDREIQNNHVVVFSDNLAPFPEGADIISDDRVTNVPTPRTEHALQPPPQKLRPIRCNSRSLPDYSHQTPPPTTALEGTLLSCYGVRSPELGFLTQVPTTTTDGRLLDTELSFSSSSDDVSGGPAEANKKPSNWKRKRKTMELVVENMMRRVLEKQEQMHKQLMETLERREKERIMREEAFKQQEIERAKKDEEVRAQERARSLALISFIENLLGLEIPITETIITSPSSMEKDEDLEPSSNKKRWPKSEVQALITVRSALEEKFLKGPKNSVWEEVAIRLSSMGYSRTAKKCKEKWENINKYYKRTIDSGKKRAENSKACPYFQELDLLYKTGLIASANPSNDVKVETQHIECESMNE